MQKKQIDLTAVITAHDEGIILHKTMRSVFEALKKVEEAGYSYEILIHLDNGDEKTKKYTERYKNDKKVLVYRNNFGDVSKSRNFATNKARGKFITFLDGDDLISDNWCLEAIKILESCDKTHEEVVVHPEAVLTFGLNEENVLTLQKESFHKEKDTIILLGENRWCSVLMAKRETLLKVPYRNLGMGYSHEDYVFNIETAELGIRHKIAKETVLFYRRTESSRLSTSNKNNATIPYMSLFDFDVAREIKNEVPITTKKSLKDKGYRVYKKIRGNDFLNYFITPVAKLTLKILDNDAKAVGGKKLPKFVVREWIKINHIDSQLYPYGHILRRLKFYSAENQSAIGKSYCKLAKDITKKPDYIFMVPWIVRGGAEKVLFNYINSLKKIYPGIKIMVVSTVVSDNIWATRLPKDVDFVDFAKYSDDLTPDACDKLFTTIITQTKCKNIHIINSEYAYNWVKIHKDLIGAEYNLNVSLFAWEYIPESKMQAVFSYDNPYLCDIYDVVNHVFTDNEEIINYSMANNGFIENKFKVHYQPLEDNKRENIKNKLVEDGKLNILWSERVVPTKLPELVAEIGKKLVDEKITIHVYGEMGKGMNKKMFDNIPTIKYHGVFDGFNSLPINKMDLLLYTSSADGMPNVILEAGAAGLPIIASDDGGAKEFVKNKKTGILVSDLTADKFAEAIKWAKNNMQEMYRYAENAQKLLDQRHTIKHFMNDVKKDIKL